MKLLTILIFVFICHNCLSQQIPLDSTIKDLDEIYVPGKIKFVELMEQKTSYTLEWRKDKKVGQVYYKIWIDTTAAIKNIEILRSFDNKFNVLVISSLIKTAGNWKVREINGKKVEYTWTDSFYFELR